MVLQYSLFNRPILRFLHNMATFIGVDVVGGDITNGAEEVTNIYVPPPKKKRLTACYAHLCFDIVV